MSQPLLSTSFYLPKDFEESRRKLIDEITKIKSVVNRNARGEFFKTETNTAQVLFGGTANNRTIFRKTFQGAALANIGVTNIAHGLTFDANLSFLKFIGTATDPVGFTAISLPSTGVTMTIDATNIILTTTVNLSAYTTVYVILEYMKS